MKNKFDVYEKGEYKAPKRNVATVFIHCSADDHPQNDNAQTMEAWHNARGFKGIGYHFFIKKDGTIQYGRSVELIPAAQEGYNTGSVAICCHGLRKELFTEQQKKSLNMLCNDINKAHGGKLFFRGHYEVEKNKTCPVFDFKNWLSLDKWKRKPL